MTILEKFLTLVAAHCCPVITINIILNLKNFVQNWLKTDFFTEIFARLFRKNLLSLKIIRRTLSLDNILITKMGWLYHGPPQRIAVGRFCIEWNV